MCRSLLLNLYHFVAICSVSYSISVLRSSCIPLLNAVYLGNPVQLVVMLNQLHIREGLISVLLDELQEQVEGRYADGLG